MKKQISFFVMVLLLSAQISFALPMSEFPASEWTNRNGYVSKTVGKLGFGLMNLLGGWTGIVSEFSEQPEVNPAAAGVRAIARVVTNTVGGAIHTVTFPVPVDVRLPGGGTSFE